MADPAAAAQAAKAAAAMMSAAKASGREAVAAFARATAPAGTCCWVCLGEGADAEGGTLLQSGCGCRGGAGYAHVACLIEHAMRSQAAHVGTDWDASQAGWVNCPTCKQRYSGAMKIGLRLGRSTRLAVASD